MWRRGRHQEGALFVLVPDDFKGSERLVVLGFSMNGSGQGANLLREVGPGAQDSAGIGQAGRLGTSRTSTSISSTSAMRRIVSMPWAWYSGLSQRETTGGVTPSCWAT